MMMLFSDTGTALLSPRHRCFFPCLNHPETLCCVAVAKTKSYDAEAPMEPYIRKPHPNNEHSNCKLFSVKALACIMPRMSCPILLILRRLKVAALAADWPGGSGRAAVTVRAALGIGRQGHE